MDTAQKQRGLHRVRQWPKEAIEEAACLTEAEQAFLVEAAAELDIRPVPPEQVPGRGPNVVEIP